MLNLREKKTDREKASKEKWKGINHGNRVSAACHMNMH